MTKVEERQLYVEDEYEVEKFYETIATKLFDATIHIVLLHNVLLLLNKNNRDNVILKYWGELTDFEIGATNHFATDINRYNLPRRIRSCTTWQYNPNRHR